MNKNKKKGRRHRGRRSQRRPKTLFYTVLTVVVIGAVLYAGYQFLQSKEAALAGTRLPDQGRSHLPACRPGGYNSTPPTSGCHSPSIAPWGVSAQSIPDELQLHNLEHGGVVIQYNPDPIVGLDANSVEDLKGFVQEKRQSRRYCKLVLAPRPGLKDPLALTAWTWLLTLAEVDEAEIQRFIDDHLERGPEQGIPC